MGSIRQQAAVGGSGPHRCCFPLPMLWCPLLTAQREHLLLLAGNHLVVIKLNPLAVLLRGGTVMQGRT